MSFLFVMAEVLSILVAIMSQFSFTCGRKAVAHFTISKTVRCSLDFLIDWQHSLFWSHDAELQVRKDSS